MAEFYVEVATKDPENSAEAIEGCLEYLPGYFKTASQLLLLVTRHGKKEERHH